MTCTIGAHSLTVGTSIKLKNDGLTFSTNSGNVTYPSSSNIGAYDTAINITSTTTTTITLNVGTTGVSGSYTFVSPDADAVISGGNYVHTFVPPANNALLSASETIQIATNSIVFTCSQDGNNSEHAYPRVGDPAYNTNLPILESTTNTIDVNVGVSTAGGLVAPLQMEFLASILENSNA